MKAIVQPADKAALYCSVAVALSSIFVFTAVDKFNVFPLANEAVLVSAVKTEIRDAVVSFVQLFKFVDCPIVPVIVKFSKALHR